MRSSAEPTETPVFAHATVRRNRATIEAQYDDWIRNVSVWRRREVPFAVAWMCVGIILVIWTQHPLWLALVGLGAADAIWSSTHRRRHTQKILRDHGEHPGFLVQFTVDGIVVSGEAATPEPGTTDKPAFDADVPWLGLLDTQFTPTGTFIRLGPGATIYVPHDALVPAGSKTLVVAALQVFRDSQKALGDAPPSREERDALEHIPAYSRLARIWDSAWGQDAAGWTTLLPEWLEELDLPSTEAALDLACGTGALLPTLVEYFDVVVGVDRSKEMLERARQRMQHEANVTCVVASFDDFELNHPVDLITCCGDSINYVTTQDELCAMFRRVDKCLRPGGAFLFDSLVTSSQPGASAMPHPSDGLWFCNDLASESFIAFSDQIEVHMRAPLRDAQVNAAAAATGLTVEARYDDDHPSATLTLRSGRTYTVIRKPSV